MDGTPPISPAFARVQLSRRQFGRTLTGLGLVAGPLGVGGCVRPDGSSPFDAEGRSLDPWTAGPHSDRIARRFPCATGERHDSVRELVWAGNVLLSTHRSGRIVQIRLDLDDHVTIFDPDRFGVGVVTLRTIRDRRLIGHDRSRLHLYLARGKDDWEAVQSLSLEAGPITSVAVDPVRSRVLVGTEAGIVVQLRLRGAGDRLIEEARRRVCRTPIRRLALDLRGPGNPRWWVIDAEDRLITVQGLSQAAPVVVARDAFALSLPRRLPGVSALLIDRLGRLLALGTGEAPPRVLAVLPSRIDEAEPLRMALIDRDAWLVVGSFGECLAVPLTSGNGPSSPSEDRPDASLFERELRIIEVVDDRAPGMLAVDALRLAPRWIAWGDAEGIVTLRDPTEGHEDRIGLERPHDRIPVLALRPAWRHFEESSVVAADRFDVDRDDPVRRPIARRFDTIRRGLRRPIDPTSTLDEQLAILEQDPALTLLEFADLLTCRSSLDVRLNRDDHGVDADLRRSAELYQRLGQDEREADTRFWTAWRRMRFVPLERVRLQLHADEVLADLQRATYLDHGFEPDRHRQAVLCRILRAWASLDLGRSAEAGELWSDLEPVVLDDPVLARSPEVRLIAVDFAMERDDWPQAREHAEAAQSLTETYPLDDPIRIRIWLTCVEIRNHVTDRMHRRIIVPNDVPNHPHCQFAVVSSMSPEPDRSEVALVEEGWAPSIQLSRDEALLQGFQAAKRASTGRVDSADWKEAWDRMVACFDAAWSDPEPPTPDRERLIDLALIQRAELAEQAARFDEALAGYRLAIRRAGSRSGDRPGRERRLRHAILSRARRGSARCAWYRGDDRILAERIDELHRQKPPAPMLVGHPERPGPSTVDSTPHPRATIQLTWIGPGAWLISRIAEADEIFPRPWRLLSVPHHEVSPLRGDEHLDRESRIPDEYPILGLSTEPGIQRPSLEGDPSWEGALQPCTPLVDDPNDLAIQLGVIRDRYEPGLDPTISSILRILK